jgi:hypothetical protein
MGISPATAAASWLLSLSLNYSHWHHRPKNHLLIWLIWSAAAAAVAALVMMAAVAASAKAASGGF